MVARVVVQKVEPAAKVVLEAASVVRTVAEEGWG